MEAHAMPLSLRDWQAMVQAIYGKKDSRDYFLGDMLLHVIEAFRGIAQGIRRESQEELLEALPRIFIWLLSFCARLKIDLEAAVWAKYPGLCPYCGAVQYCSCIAQREKPNILYRNNGAVPPATLDEWQRMFERIYGRVNRLVSLSTIGFHLSEELAEVCRGFRFRSYEEGQEELREELADVFAWIMALAVRSDIMLGGHTYKAYPGVCNVCRCPECNCPKV